MRNLFAVAMALKLPNSQGKKHPIKMRIFGWQALTIEAS